MTKILRLTAENLKKIVVVDITPASHMVQITGANGSGKTSVLDAIWLALAGTRNMPAEPIRKGETSARIRLDLGELIVTRRFTEGGATTLTVEQPNGARFPSPQKMLDGLLGALTFDPLAFSRMAPKEQLEQLRRLVPVSIDLDSLAAQNARDFAMRTDVNRDIKQLQVRVKDLAAQLPPELPEAPIDISALLDQMSTAAQYNAGIADQHAQRQRMREVIDQKNAEAGRLWERARELERQAAACKAQGDELGQWCIGQMEALEAADPIPEYRDTATLKQEIADAQLMNDAIKQREQYQAVLAELDGKERQSEELTAAINTRNDERAAAIAAAEMPIDGLAFGDAGVLYNGLPFDQASTAEQLRVSVAIAMALNPTLRVLRIQHGNDLDETSFGLLAQMAAERDYQVWIEQVDTTGNVGIVMEEGQVRGAAAAATEVTA